MDGQKSVSGPMDRPLMSEYGCSETPDRRCQIAEGASRRHFLGATKERAMTDTRVLLVGYNGANNTGAEALLLADIADVRAVLGPDAIITIPSLNEANLRRYVKEGPRLRIVTIPTFYFPALWR